MSAVVLAGLSVGAAEAAGGGPKATGGAHSPLSDLSFNAQEGPNGPKGRVNYRAVDAMTGEVTSFKGEVTCYTQEGNRAAFSGEVTKSSENVDYDTFLFEVVDNGEGTGITPPGDAFRFEEDADPEECEITEMTDTVVTNGNIQVHEAE